MSIQIQDSTFGKDLIVLAGFLSTGIAGYFILVFLSSLAAVASSLGLAGFFSTAGEGGILSSLGFTGFFSTGFFSMTDYLSSSPSYLESSGLSK